MCSPARALFNASLFVGALLVAVGAVLVRPVITGPRTSVIAPLGVTALLLAGVSGATTAPVPLDIDLELHPLVSTPAFVLQPVGLLLMAWRLDGSIRATSMVVVGVVTLLVGSFFAVRLDLAGGGLLERLILWPAVVVLGVAGYGAARRWRLHGPASRASSEQAGESATAMQGSNRAVHGGERVVSPAGD